MICKEIKMVSMSSMSVVALDVSFSKKDDILCCHRGGGTAGCTAINAENVVGRAQFGASCLAIGANMSKYGYTTFFFPNYHELSTAGWLLASKLGLQSTSKAGHGLSVCW